jgi:hypothetical protein
MGVVQPNPTFSPSSTAQSDAPHIAPETSVPRYPSIKTNPTLLVLAAREYLQEQAYDEIAKNSQPGRQIRRFIDTRTLIDTMKLRDRGLSDTAIEERLKLKPGTVRRLGRHGVLSHLSQK